MKKKVVIIGGGFAGSYAAKKLEKDFSVTLIDTKDYFEFTPGILRTIVEPTHLRKIQVLHAHYLKWAELVVGRVTDVTDTAVLIGKRKVAYDYLIIASGSHYNAPFKEHNVFADWRGKKLREYYDNLCKARSVLIIGGGIVGVEMAGEIFDKYGNEKDVTIVHAKDRLIDRNHAKAIQYAETYLVKRGLKVQYNERVESIKGKICYTNKGKEICPDLIFLCTGITPNYLFMKKHLKDHLNERHQVIVDSHLRLRGKKNIFAIGDVVDVQEEKTAQNAERQASLIVSNICALEKSEEMQEYVSKQTPMIISLGKWRGIYHHGSFVMRGFIPAVMKMLVEKWEMQKKRRLM